MKVNFARRFGLMLAATATMLAFLPTLGQANWVQGKPFPFRLPGANYCIVDQKGETREVNGWLNDQLQTWDLRPGATQITYGPQGVAYQTTEIVLDEFVPKLIKNFNNVHATWPEIGVGPYYAQVRNLAGTVLTSSWVSSPSFDFTVPGYDEYYLDIAPTGKNFKTFRFRTSDYARTRSVTPWFPTADTTKRQITFSFEPSPDDVAYYFQLYGLDGKIYQSQYIYSNSATFAVDPGSYKWRVTPFTIIGSAYVPGPEMEWVNFNVKTSISGMETLVGRDPLAETGAQTATLSYPTDSLQLPDGRVIVSDSDHHVLRILDHGRVSVFVGTGVAGYNGDGARTQVQLNQPGPLGLGPDGAVYFGDTANFLLRKLDLSTGQVSTVAGLPQTLGSADANGVPTSGALGYLGYFRFHNGVLTFSAAYGRPGGHYIKKLYQISSGTVSLIPAAASVTADAFSGFDWDGADLVVIRQVGTQTNLTRITSGGVATDLASINGLASGVVVLADGSIVYGNHTSLELFRGGVSTALPVDAANFLSVKRLGDGTVMYVDTDGAKVGRIDPTTLVANPVITTTGSPFSTVVDVVQESADSLLILCNSPSGIYRYSVSTGAISKVAFNGQLDFSLIDVTAQNSPCRYASSLAVDSTGNILVSEQNGITRISPVTGTISRFAGTAELSGFHDGVDRAAALFASPRGISFDQAGNLTVSDTYNLRIRKIDRQTGLVTTIAGDGSVGFNGNYNVPATSAGLNHPLATLSTPFGLYIVQGWRNTVSWEGSDTYLRPAAGLDDQGGYQGVGGFADGYRLNARFNTPNSVHPINSFNDLLVADQFNNRIRRVNSYVTTVAGDGRSGYSPYTLNLPNTAIYVAGNVIIADTGNGQLRSIRLP